MENFRKPGNWWVPAAAHLTERQATALADVVTEWSILEIKLQDILICLIQSPHALGQALTEDLGPDNRLKALKRLARTWLAFVGDGQGRASPATVAGLKECSNLATWVSQAKGRRNQIAHWSWFRTDDETIFGAKYRTTPIQAYPPNAKPPQGHETVEGMVNFAQQINEVSKRLSDLELALNELPTWPRRYSQLEPDWESHSIEVQPELKLPPPPSPE